MYSIKSNNNFYKNKIYDLLTQKKIPILLDNKIKIFGELNFDFSDKKLKIFFYEDSLTFDLPLDIEKFFREIYNLLSDNYIQVGELYYYPIKELVTKKKLSINLRNTHNLIFNQALINNYRGILKTELYSLIWPTDFNIQINKLDTHLTNLKSLLRDELNYDFKFISSQGKIKFLLD